MIMLQTLGGKVAVVTGGASGIGLALARRFVAEGMSVMLADVDRKALEAAQGELGKAARFQVTDVANSGSVESLASASYDAFGAVHVLCNNAGVSSVTPAPVWETPLQDWEWVLGVNLMGIVHGLRAFVPRMLRSGQPGHILNTASLAGLVVFPGGGAYGPSKHAAVALSELVGQELEQRDAPIGVSVLCPAWVRTRILDDERNRPPALRAAAPTADAVQLKEQLSKSMAETGLDPAVVAEEVVTAIHQGRFYVLPNPEWSSAVVDRAKRVVAGGPLSPPLPSE